MQEPDPVDIRAAMAGDTAAFERLVRAYQLPVWRFLSHQLGDRGLAEDVAQDAFVNLYRRLGTFDFRAKFSTWVFQVARNAGIDAMRRRARQDRVARAVHRPLAAEGPEGGFELSAALADLPPALREALLVVEVLGLPYADAASVLTVPEGTVKSRVFRARRLLSEWMAAGEAADEL